MKTFNNTGWASINYKNKLSKEEKTQQQLQTETNFVTLLQ